jgi:hypothetical protein
VPCLDRPSLDELVLLHAGPVIDLFLINFILPKFVGNKIDRPI